MANKVSISKKAAHSIEHIMGLMDKHKLIEMHSFKKTKEQAWVSEQFEGLNELTLDQLCTALYVGYEIKKQPEERILEKYKEKTNEGFSTPSHVTFSKTADFREGMVFVLDELGMKIKGINDEG